MDVHCICVEFFCIQKCIVYAYNNCSQRIFPLRIHQNDVGCGVAQIPLAEVITFPQNFYMTGFKGASLQQDGETITEREKRTRLGAEGKGRGKRGIAPWLLGEIDAPDYIYFMHMHVYCIVFFLAVEKL